MRLRTNDAPGKIISRSPAALPPRAAVKSGIGRSSEYFPQIYDVFAPVDVIVEPKKKVTIDTLISLTAPTARTIRAYTAQAITKAGLVSNTAFDINETMERVPLAVTIQNNTEASIKIDKGAPVLQFHVNTLEDARIAWESVQDLSAAAKTE